MAARAFMEQVRTVILQRRVRETQSRSEPAGVFQSPIAHSMECDTDSTDVCGDGRGSRDGARPGRDTLEHGRTRAYARFACGTMIGMETAAQSSAWRAGHQLPVAWA